MTYDFIDVQNIDDTSLSFWQSKNWQTLLLSSGQAREAFYFGDTQSTFLLVEIRQISFGFFGAFILGINSSQVGSDFLDCLSALKILLKERGILFLQIEPIEEIQEVLSIVSSSPVYKKFLTPYTRTVKLTQSADTILENMHEKGRYNIRLATKRGVEIEEVLPTDENLETWMTLLTDTTMRDGFAQNSRMYYEKFLSIPEVKMLFAKKDGRTIAAGIFVFTKKRAIYYYGASSSLGSDRKHMAPYLLQWHAIEQAKSQHIPLYDFLGVADPNNSHDSLVGVSEFKQKFGGNIENLPKKLCFPLSLKGSVILFLRRIFSR